MGSITLTREDLEQIHPETLLPPGDEFGRTYQNLQGFGLAAASRKSCVFVGLARNVSGVLQLNANRIEQMGSMFREYGVVVVENDSTDDTKSLLAQWEQANPNVFVRSFDNGRPHLVGFEPERVANLAEYRNIARDLVEDRYPDFDFVCVLDLDVWGGFAGIETSVAWHEVTPDAGGLASVSVWETEDGHKAHYDQWAYRRHGWDCRFEAFFNYWVPPCGADIIPVRSAFGGMAIYKTQAFLSARYEGGDCEHVRFHRNIRRNGHMMYLNPSQRVVVTSARLANEKQKRASDEADLHGNVCQNVD